MAATASESVSPASLRTMAIVASVEVVAAVHVEGLAGDGTRQIGGEEQDGRGYLVRVGDVVQRRAGGDLGVHRLRRRPLLGGELLEISLERRPPDVSWHDGVDPYLGR